MKLRLKAALTIISSVLIFLYPLVIFFGLSYFEPRYLALYLFLVLAIRFSLDSSSLVIINRRAALVFIALGVALVGYTLASNRLEGLKLYPVVISFSLLVIFGLSLIYPPSVIERIARLKEPDLPDRGVIYTRRVTMLWCVFFLLNGLVAIYTSAYVSTEIWTLYNGLISYILMGCLFAGEWLYRTLYIRPGSD